MAGVVVVPARLAVTPGGSATCTVKIKNTGNVVDSYTIGVVGEAAAWSTPMPAVVSLFPGGEGEATISFHPPRASSLRAGDVDFGVRVQATQDPSGSVVEEGVVTVEPFVEVSAKITPRTSEAKRSAKHSIVVNNTGNAPVRVELSAADPDELLVFGLRPDALTIEPGATGTAEVKVAARQGFMRGADRHRPFHATVVPPGGGVPQTLDATLVQRAGLPRFVPALVAAVVVIALFAVVLPGMMKKDSGGTFDLSSADGGATTTTLASDEEAVEEGEATATEVEGAATESKPGESGGSGPATTVAPAGTDGGTAVAGTGGGGAAPVVTQPGDEPAPSTPDEKPVAVATTAKPTTTTTQPPVHSQGTAILHGTYLFDFDSGAETQNGADVWWRQDTQSARYLEPRSPAVLSNMGKPNFDGVTLAQLKGRSYSAAPINGSDGADAMPAGTVIAVKTTSGRYAKVLVEARNVPDPSRHSIQNIRIRWVTYA